LPLNQRNTNNNNNNNNKNNQFSELVKNRFYIIINLLFTDFRLNINNWYNINIFIKPGKLFIPYPLLFQIKKVYKINYNFKNVLNYNNKILKLGKRIKYTDS